MPSLFFFQCWSDMKKPNATEIMSARCLIKIVTKLVDDRWYLLPMHADTAVGGLFLSASQELTQPMANLTKSRIWKKHYRLNFYSTRLKKNPTSLHHKQSAATSLLFFALFIVGDTEDSLAESLGTI